MSGNPEGGTVRCEVLDGGAIWHVVLATPKANIVDMDKADQLAAIFSRAREDKGLKAVLIEGEGPNFSFGASVPEHLPGSFEKMIPGFHQLFRRIIESSVITLAAVRGQCLGGGLELVSFCNRIFASPEAKLGQPEIMLGVFPPVASVVLPERVGRGAAEHLCLSGKSVSAEEALRIGLVDQVDDDPVALALIRDALEAGGHQVYLSAEGVGLLDELLARTMEVVIMDVEMPKVSGGKLVEMIHKTLPPPHPRVILFSAKPAEELRRLYRKLGIHGFLRKGCQQDHLLKFVEEAVEYYNQELT